VFIATGLFTTSCGGNSMDDIEQLNIENELLPVATSKNIRLILSDSGEVKIEMRAPNLERFIIEGEPPYNLLSSGMEVNFFDSLGNVDANVKCEHAIHYPEKQILILTKNVVVVNIEGDRLNSEYLIWNAKTKKITSNDFVKITTGDEIMYGDGFEADQDLTNYEIRNIKGIISVEDEDI
jgi:LPS export ABC transporter protein LptC